MMMPPLPQQMDENSDVTIINGTAISVKVKNERVRQDSTFLVFVWDTCPVQNSRAAATPPFSSARLFARSGRAFW